MNKPQPQEDQFVGALIGCAGRPSVASVRRHRQSRRDELPSALPQAGDAGWSRVGPRPPGGGQGHLSGPEPVRRAAPNALAYSLDVLPERYEAIICDEGQDFREEFWVPLELLLADCDRSPLYVFYDDNQNIYARASTFPIRGEPFPLTVNCRNTA